MIKRKILKLENSKTKQSKSQFNENRKKKSLINRTKGQMKKTNTI